MIAARILPLVAVAATALFCLKVFGWVAGVDGQLSGPTTVRAQNVDDSAMDVAAADEAMGDDVAADEGSAKAPPGDDGILQDGGRAITPGTQRGARPALVERLGDRRAALDKREEELNLREALLEATEKQIDDRIKELEQLEKRVTQAAENAEDERLAELGRIITVYESMKAKDAARIFDRLETEILVAVARQMKPRKMADILGRMAPAAAEKLTLALAGAQLAEDETEARALPKIEGTPMADPSGTAAN